MLEAFRASAAKARALNLLYLLTLLLAWTSTIVGFSCELIHIAVPPGFISIYWNKVVTSGGTYPLDEFFPLYEEHGAHCPSASKAFLVFQLFAFLPLLLLGLPTAVFRIVSFPVPVYMKNNRKSLLIELCALAVGVFWLFLATAIYGASCFAPLKKLEEDDLNRKGTGFGYCIFGLLSGVIALVLLLFIRRDPLCQLGLESSPAGSTGFSEYSEALSVSEEGGETVAQGYQSDAYDPNSQL